MKRKQKYNGRLKILKMCATTLLLSILALEYTWIQISWDGE